MIKLRCVRLPKQGDNDMDFINGINTAVTAKKINNSFWFFSPSHSVFVFETAVKKGCL